ncbi:MAG: hypothetical protein OHK0039_47480 [Bacteroidia bacterium]
MMAARGILGQVAVFVEPELGDDGPGVGGVNHLRYFTPVKNVLHLVPVVARGVQEQVFERVAVLVIDMQLEFCTVFGLKAAVGQGTAQVGGCLCCGGKEFFLEKNDEVLCLPLDMGLLIGIEPPVVVALVETGPVVGGAAGQLVQQGGKGSAQIGAEWLGGAGEGGVGVFLS